MTETEQQIINNLHRFDLLALLRLLHHLNYQSVWFVSNDSLVSEVRIIQEIEFRPQGVIIRLNLGLLSPQSPLPGYILQLRDTLMDYQDEFKHFIGYFDHILIQHLVFGLFPELNRSGFGNWRHYQHNSLLLTDLRAVRSIQMLFDYVYPECVVVCERNRRIECRGLDKQTLGEIELGCRYKLGDVTYASAKGILVWLDVPDCEQSLAELKYRLRSVILPLLSRFLLHLEVRVRGVMQPLKISGSQPASILGFHPLLRAPYSGQVTLFYGQTYCRGGMDE